MNDAPLVNPAFITGSRAYGTPTEKSDVDLVVLVEPETLRFLDGIFGDPLRKAEEGLYKDMLTTQLRIGKLNLILCNEVKHYHQWKTGTKMLKAIAPGTREKAVDFFATLRKED